MRRCISTGLVSLALGLGALGQPSPLFGQCGGTGYNGSITCTAGSSCVKSGAAYSQCTPTVSGDVCAGLARQVGGLIPGFDVSNVVAEVLAAGSTFNQGVFDYAQPVSDLPELCRFGASFNTSSQSSVKFEVWMPTSGWNGRFAFVGNGLAAGGVNYPDMGGAVSNYGFAVASTDAGHEASGLDGTFAANNPQSQIDFGYRAVHLSTVFAKNAVRAYYGAQEKKSYWIGCSSGGKQGLKEAQMYPEDYDGVLAGSPAWWWSHLTGWSIMGGLMNPSGAGYMSTDDWSSLHQSIMSQCDALDGLADGIITNPALCKVNWAATNLSAAQQKQAAAYYTNWTDTSGSLLFPGYSPGSEELGLTGANPTFTIGFPTDYFKYQVLNYTSVAAASGVTFTDPKQLAQLVATADKTNPGGITADNYNISPFIKRGGKLLHYGGTQDQLIDWGSSILYHERVRQTLGDVSNSYRLFAVPGMGHCAGGSKSPNVFGNLPGVSGQPPSNNSPSNNAILALMQWVENGTAPDTIVGSGSGFSRPLCPYPTFAKYVGGDNTLASSFVCQ